MTVISLNHLSHHTHGPCSLVRCAVYFPKLPVERTVPFDSTTEQPFFPYILFHLAENSHRFFHTNGKRSWIQLNIQYVFVTVPLFCSFAPLICLRHLSQLPLSICLNKIHIMFSNPLLATVGLGFEI